MKKIISNILLILGILIIITAISLKLYSKNKENQLINDFNNTPVVQEDNENKKDNNESNKEIKGMALIEIPSINLKSIIVNGTSLDILRYYLGHFKDTAKPGEYGNFAIAGHSSLIYNEILNNLYKVNVGDKIIIKTKEQEFVYKITEKFVVKPTEIEVLKQDRSKKEMTIVTCTNKGKERLIVKAELY